MRMSKGFSLVEMMVAAGVTALFLSLALPFFMFQTSQQSASSRAKFADQDVDLALNFMRRDIMQAGFGCRGHKELALYVIDGGAGGDPDQLYVNYGGYLNMMGPIGLETMATCSTSAGLQAHFLLLNSIFFSTANQHDIPCPMWQHLTYQGVIDWDLHCKYPGPGRFALYGIPSNITKREIGGVIAKTKGTSTVDAVMDVNLYLTNDTPTVQPSSLPDSLHSLEFEVVGNGCPSDLAGRLFAPAISYRMADASLWRNPGPVGDEWGRPLIGGLPSMEITDFQVRCQFKSPLAATPVWTPEVEFEAAAGKFVQKTPSQLGSGVYILDNLRLLEITIRYKTKLRSEYGTKWTGDRTRTVFICPRTVVMLSE